MILPGDRFFGRIDRFTCECPACGYLIVASKDQSIPARRLARIGARSTVYNPITSVVYCACCRRAYSVGLLLWRIQRGGGRHLLPPDQQPTVDQMARLRVAISPTEYLARGAPINRAYALPCTCPWEVSGMAAECPVHGWEK